jgi:hypothetical protein
MRWWIAVVGFGLGVARADTPRDFTPDVQALYAVAACGGPAPAVYDAKVVAAHCKAEGATIAMWKSKWRDPASTFFADLLKAGYPSTVVYPFGGGDLATALVVYPDATDYTTLSLEGMGDPRPLAALAASPKKLATGLDKLRALSQMAFGWAWNTTDQLSIDSSESGSGVPGILTLTLVALDANGYEPVDVRFFKLGKDGAIVYLTRDDIEAWDAEQARLKPPGRHKASNALQQGLLVDVEIAFRKKGDPRAPVKHFRHIAADLSDDGLAKDGAALAYLDTKRDIAAVTKAASYLLWKPGFSKVRDYLLHHMKVMISDDTGIPPRYAQPAGFTQEVWGPYAGPFFSWATGDVSKEMVKLWAATKTRPLPFRFGYFDNRRQPHLLYTHR